MNSIWISIICLTTLYCIATKDYQAVTDVFMNVGEETFEFVIPLLCTTAFWNGILYIAKEASLLHALERLFHPLLKRLLPDIQQDDETLGYVASNVVVNMVGLGYAATPMGLKAMQGMQKHNPNKEVATRSMVTFLVMNTAGVTILNTMIIGLRVSFHATDVSGFMPYAIVSTCIASIAGLTWDRWRNYHD